VFRALVAIAAAKPRDEDVASLLQEPDPDPTDLAALDAAWEDEPVTFGPGATNGCKDGIIARIRAGKRPAPSAGVHPTPSPIGAAEA
jgi:nitrate reductase delta subunit